QRLLRRSENSSQGKSSQAKSEPRSNHRETPGWGDQVVGDKSE
ncbi:MAG: hypothetical protein ACI93T_003748, partial [Porticoccaceae bacterium]